MRLIAAILLLVLVTAGYTSWRLGAVSDEPVASDTPFKTIDKLGSISNLERYDDPDYGFSFAIPAGWRTIIAVQSEVDTVDDWLDDLEPGYAVGFEAPRSGNQDRFADYILIELLPGEDFGLFDASGAQTYVFESEQESFTYHRLEIDSALDDTIDVDLVIFQRGVQALGYTLAFYAIGEPADEHLLFQAFQIMLRTFEQHKAPFVII